MKRLLLRLSALSVVVMLGLIAIARAQRGEAIGDSQQAGGNPFANSQSLAVAPASDTAAPLPPSNTPNSSGSSVRFVSVQDVPSESPSVPSRPAPSDGQPAGGATLTIRQPTPSAANDLEPPMESVPERRFPFGLHRNIAEQANSAIPPAEPIGNRSAALAATAVESPTSGNVIPASANDPISSNQPPPSAAPAHSIFLGPLSSPQSSAAPLEVAQAPAMLEPPPGATPLMPPQSAAPQQVQPEQTPPSASTSVYGASSNGAAATSSYAAPQSVPQPPADAGPTLAPMSRQTDTNPSGMTMGSLRPIDPVSAGPDAMPPAGAPVHPDAKHVEGSQSPRLTIEKIAPREVQVGKPARFELRVRNIGSAAAQGVEIHDSVPQGTQFISSNPPTTQGPDGQLAWSLGELKPGDQTSVQLELLPVAEGDIRSMATVTFRTEVSVHTLATRPRLTLSLSGPKQVLIGGEATMTVSISNPGTGAATGVVLSEHVPRGLRHKAGSELEFDVGTLRPGQSRQIELTMSAVEAGHIINTLQARGDAKLRTQARVEFDVVAPALSVAMTGPTRRYLERQATYTVAVSNPGTAPARDVELVTQLPKGMKFVKANNAGHYDPQTHTVTWNLEELPPAQTGSVTLVAVPIEAGEQRMKIEGKARQGLSDAKEKTVLVEGLAAVTFDVRGADEAIEVGGETSYQIHVTNEGSMAATNLQVTAQFPPELKPLRADGPAHGAIDRRTVQFGPIARLEPKGEATFRIRAKAIQPGDLRVKVQVQTDDMHEPVLKEENTRVYVDH